MPGGGGAAEVGGLVGAMAVRWGWRSTSSHSKPAPSKETRPMNANRALVKAA